MSGMKTKTNVNNLYRKLLLAVALIAICHSALAAEKLGMFVEVKRYLADNSNTRYEIDYQVPYKNMLFLTRDRVFFAELKVSLSISNADSVVFQKEFTNNIGVSSKYDVTSSGKAFLDRISMTLASAGFVIRIRFEDVNSAKMYDWEYEVKPLGKEDSLSDLELVTLVTADSTAMSAKFKRGEWFFQPNPAGVFSKDIYDSLFCYIEPYLKNGQTNHIRFSLSKDNTEILSQDYTLEGTAGMQPQILTINLSDLELGKYTATLECGNTEHLLTRQSELIITHQTEKLNFIFADPDDEYLLLRYLSSVKAQSSWKSMSKEAKMRYISQLWEALASAANISVAEALAKYQERIDFCNKYYSHFEPGWKSDMGRIYIRLGAPSDIEKDETSDDTKFVRKDFQIWRYNNFGSPVYIFVDKQMNGNYRLVYAINDDNEKTSPDWRKYLGSQFDEDRLTKRSQE